MRSITNMPSDVLRDCSEVSGDLLWNTIDSLKVLSRQYYYTFMSLVEKCRNDNYILQDCVDCNRRLIDILTEFKLINESLEIDILVRKVVVNAIGKTFKFTQSFQPLVFEHLVCDKPPTCKL